MSKTKLRIHTWPERTLKEKCKKVEAVTDEVRQILAEMLSLMRASKGAGLAANQAGLNFSLVVAEVEGRTFKLVNPQIVSSQGLTSFVEGCLSFPGLELKIKRKNKIRISAQDEKGQPLELEAEGILAVIFQHEIDHIEGKVFINRIPFWEKLRISPRLRKIIRRTKNELLKQREK